MNVSAITLIPNQYYYIAQYNTYALYKGISVGYSNQPCHMFVNDYGLILQLPIVNLQYAYY